MITKQTKREVNYDHSDNETVESLQYKMYLDDYTQVAELNITPFNANLIVHNYNTTVNEDGSTWLANQFATLIENALGNDFIHDDIDTQVDNK